MSGFSQYFINNLKQKITLSDFIKTAVSWDKKKSSPSRQDWWAPCPFHYEKSASFHVDDRKGFYHCFGCGIHGSIVDWLLEFQKMTFVEAMTHLCQVTNTPLPEFSKENFQKTEKKKSLYDLMHHAQAYFSQLLYHPHHLNALNYVMQKRGITKDTIEKYGIGYASNNRTGLFDFLTQKGYSPTECLESGLVIIPDDGKPYDRFRDRIMFPVKNQQGHIITYGGRALGIEAKAKYLNGSETEIFKKSLVLYNLDKATLKPPPKSHTSNTHLPNTHLIVCEGYVDVITLGGYGFNAAVAPMGTALTLEQIKLLWRYDDEPILCFDGDKAGLDAACRVSHKVLEILEAGYSLKFCFLPDNLDPDDYLRQNGKDSFKKLLDNAVTLSAVLFAQTVNSFPPETPEKRAGLEKELFALCEKIQDARLRKLYQSDLFSRLHQFVAQKPKHTIHSRNHQGYHTNQYKKPWNTPHYYESSAVTAFKQNRDMHAHDSLDYIETMIFGFFVRFMRYLKADDFDILSQISFQTDDKQQLQRAILNIFLKNCMKPLENSENMPIMPSDKIDYGTGDLWQLPPDICQSDLYRRSLYVTDSIEMTLNLPFINQNDRINYLSDQLRHGLFDKYHKLLSKKEADNFSKELSSLSPLEEEKSLERLLHIRKSMY